MEGATNAATMMPATQEIKKERQRKLGAPTMISGTTARPAVSVVVLM
jgi:hypothetical protein